MNWLGLIREGRADASRPARPSTYAHAPRTVLAVLVAFVTAVAACSSSTREAYDYFRVTIDGQPALGISAKDKVIRAVVVFFHGTGANEFAPIVDEPHKTMTEKLVSAGFAVVSSNAGGDAFGNQASQRNYIYLGGTAAEHYRTQNVFLLAESMGAIAATNLLAMGLRSRIRGLAAINPMLDLSAADPRYSSTIAASYGNQPTDSVNPMNLSPDALRDQNVRFYVSPNDALVPADANARLFQAHFGSVANISIVECSGPHGDPSCLQGEDIVKWFSQLERVKP